MLHLTKLLTADPTVTVREIMNSRSQRFTLARQIPKSRDYFPSAIDFRARY